MSKEEIIGTYRKNQKGFGFVKIEDQEDEIYISRENSKNALNGDTVAIKIIAEKEGDKKQEGKIVKIVRHEKDTVVGTFQKSRNFAFVVPDDKNFGTDIFISKANWGKARDKKKVLVQILKYPEKGKNAEGKVIEVLGGINEAGVDMLSLIKQYELPYKFPDEVVAEAKAYGDKIDPSDLPRRRDLRNDIIFTIDGEDAKDLDDAIHVEKLENGNYKLDVHIADVSHYVREKTELDKEAYLRGTSIYMLGRVIPMLPRELSNGICSLNAGEDRYTLSCSMEITPKAKIVSSDIYKGVICVTERMCYTDVQKILDRSDETVLKRYEKYISYFDLMAELANILKAKRKENGYLNLEIPESKIILDENGVAIDVKKYETYFANEIINDVKGSDIAVDIHASNIFLREMPQVRISEETADALVPLARLLNVDFVWIYPAATVLQSTFACSMNSVGTRCLVVEMGVGMRLTPAYGEQLTEGILNLMRSEGMWDGKTHCTHTPLISRDEVAFVNAGAAGIFMAQARHGSSVKKGQLLGIIADPLTGNINERVTAPADGLLFTLREYPVVYPGSLLARIVTGGSRE